MSCFFFLDEIYTDNRLFNFVLLVSCVFVLLPLDKLLEIDLIGIKESEVNKETFNEAYFYFASDYQMMNPLTKEKGMIDYINKLREFDYIDEKEKEDLISDVNDFTKSNNLIEAYLKGKNKKQEGKRRIKQGKRDELQNFEKPVVRIV